MRSQLAFACAGVAMLWASSAEALIAVREADLLPNNICAEHVNVSHAYKYSSQTSPICVYIDFPYLQRMTIGDGPSVMALTDVVYPPGRQDLSLYAECDGWLIYTAGDCDC